MAISSDKLLNRPSELHRRYGGRLAMQKAQQEKMVGGGPVSIIFTKKSIKNIELIKDNVVKIEGILKGTIAAEKKALDEKKKKESSQRREKQEEKLEAKPDMSMGSIKMPRLPRMGILDWIKNFIGKIILGYFAYRLIDHLPKIIPIVKFIGNATDFIIDVGGKLLNGLATFIDWGYKAYDATRGFIKNIGGENFAQGFDKFVGAIDTALFLTTILAGDLALEAMTAGGGGPGGGGSGGGRGGRPGRGGGDRYVGGFRQTERMSRNSNWQGFNLWKQQAKGGELTEAGWKKAENDIMKRYFQRYGRDAFVQRFGQEGLERLPGGMQRGLLQRGARSAFVGVLGKGGAKAVLSTVRPLLKRLPIIGALIDFGLSVALGEDPGRAAFKAIGAGLLGSIGAAVGSVVPIAGNLIGGIVGGMAGDAIGGALYDMFFGGKKPKPKVKVQGKAGGGITRGGKSKGGVKRTLKKGKYKRVLAKKPSPTKIETKNEILKKTGEELDKTKYFGPILAITSKIMAKQEPTQKDYENVGLGINMLISKGVEDGQLKGGLVAAFAEGGVVDDEFLSAAEKGSDISNWVAKTFQGEIESNAQKTLRLIRERKEEKIKEGKDQQDPSLDVGPGGTVTGGNADFWTLVAIARMEDADPQGSADVAQSIYNRVASGIYGGKTIKEIVLRQGQYEPTWKYPRRGKTGVPNPEWHAIKDLASASAATGISQGDLQRTAAALRNSKYQEEARKFVGGRTDFMGGGNKKGAEDVQRTTNTPNNFFGWFVGPAAKAYGAKNPGPAKAPQLGDIVVMGGGGPLGSGKVSGVDSFTSIASQYGLSLTSSYRSGDPGYHGKNRARDYSNDAVGRGTPQQLAFAKHLSEKYGSSLTQLIYTPLGYGIANGKKVGLDYWGSSTNAQHYHHVHVALAKGGRVLKPSVALIGEKGPEFVFDADTTKGLDSMAYGLLEKLNIAKTKPQLASILQSYTAYEQPYAEPEYIEVPVPMPISDGGGDYSSGGFAMPMGGGEEDGSFNELYVGG